MQKSALITGITGQDGAYLAAKLLANHYRVYGAYRRTSSTNFWRLQELGVAKHPDLHLVELDITDLGTTIRLIEKIKIEEVYNLAAQSFVGLSFAEPLATTQISAMGALNMLEAIRIVNRDIRFYQASTSEMFGKVQTIPQNEMTPFYPRSPYGVAKLFAHWTTINYRESYNIFAASGILFNHESPLRGLEFVTRKITDGIAKIKLGMLDKLSLGNIDAKRDWGYAEEFVEGMYLMLQAEKPDTYVLATGRTESVREFIMLACKSSEINIAWEGKGEKEVGIDAKTGKIIIDVNPLFYRPAEVDLLRGDSTKAQRELGWSAKTPLEEIVTKMVEADMRRNANGSSY